MKKFTETPHCTSRAHCVACRNPDGLFVKSMEGTFEWDGKCPFGITESNAEATVLEQAKSLTKAVGRIAKAVVKGDPVLVSEEIKAERQAICDTCEFYDAAIPKCKKCGCRTEYKLKVATESCPIDKWSKI